MVPGRRLSMRSGLRLVRCMFGGLSGAGYLETNLRSTEGSSQCYSYDMRAGGYERVCNIRVSSGVPPPDIKTALYTGVFGSETALKACEEILT